MMTLLRNANAQERRLAMRSIWDRMKWAVRANVFSRLKHGHLPRTKLVWAWKQVMWHSLIELRYVRKTRDQTIGAELTNKLRSPLRPSSGARPPSSRPGGPLIVYLDIQQNRDASTCLLTQLPQIESRIDLVTVVRDLGSPVGYRRASASEMQGILGLEGRAIDSETDVLGLAEFAIGSVLLNCEQDRITAKSATKSLFQRSSEDAVQQGNALSEVALQLSEMASIPKVQLEEFVRLLIAGFGLP
jgi:hypothetical protein